MTVEHVAYVLGIRDGVWVVAVNAEGREPFGDKTDDLRLDFLGIVQQGIGPASRDEPSVRAVAAIGKPLGDEANRPAWLACNGETLPGCPRTGNRSSTTASITPRAISGSRCAWL